MRVDRPHIAIVVDVVGVVNVVKRCFTLNDGNIAAMSREAGLPRNTIYRRLEKYGLVAKKPRKR